MRKLGLMRLVLSGLMIALVTVMTMLIHWQVPFLTQGAYIHPGDSMIYLSGYLLGGPLAAIIGGIGSAIADSLVGAYQYTFATLVIKTIMGFIAGYFLYRRQNQTLKIGIFGMILSSIWMVLGYTIYEYFAFGAGYLVTSVPWNIIQAISGVLIAVPIIGIIRKISYIENIRKL